MEFQSYNAELAIANLLFKNIFSNIRIGRTNDAGEEKQILVQCVLGQRSRILKSLQNPERRGNYKVPMIVINRTGYSRNGERLNNLHNEVKYELASYYRKYNLLTPIPVDINYDVTIIAKYPADVDKIASNFMVFFNSDIYVSCEHPKYEGVKLNNQVIMSDSVSEEHPDELDSGTDDLITSTFQFTFKTYLFGGTTKAKLEPAKILSSVTSSFISSIIVELKPNEIDDFQKQYPDKCVSATLTTYVTADVSTYIDNPEVSVYTEIPVINKIDFGFYAIPHAEDIDAYIESVDNGAFGPHEHEDISGYISSESYVRASAEVFYDPYISVGYPPSACEFDATFSPLSGINDYYDKVDSKCSLEPYVDKLYWKIDPLSPYQYPNNVEWDRG